MKQFKVRIRLKTANTAVETIVNANTTGDVKRLIEGQYGSNLQSIGVITEVK